MSTVGLGLYGENGTDTNCNCDSRDGAKICPNTKKILIKVSVPVDIKTAIV